jgi:hypothetical protein
MRARRSRDTPSTVRCTNRATSRLAAVRAAPALDSLRGVPDDSVLPVDDEAPHEAEVVVIEAISDPIATARRRHGKGGAMLAAGMFGVDIALGRKPKEDAPIVIAAGSLPVDIDADGIEIPIDEATSVFAPPQPPSDPFPPRRPRK